MVVRDGPLNAALNSARSDPDEICATDAQTPILVILRSRTDTRRFIVNMGGCPGVLLNDGTELTFTPTGVKLVSAVLAKVSHTGSAPPRTASPSAIAHFVTRAARAESGRFTASYRIALFKNRGRIFRGRVFVSQLSATRAVFREMPGFSPFYQGQTYAYEVLTGERYYVNCDQIRRGSPWECMSEIGEGMGAMGEQNWAIVPAAFTGALDEAVSNYGSPALLVPTDTAGNTTPAPIFLSSGSVDGRAVQCLSIGNAAGAVERVCTTGSGIIVSYRIAQPQGDNDYASAQLLSYTTKVNPRAVNPPAKPLAPGQ